MDIMEKLVALGRRLGDEGLTSEEGVEEEVYQFIMSDSHCPGAARGSRDWCKKNIMHPRFGQGGCQKRIEEENEW